MKLIHPSYEFITPVNSDTYQTLLNRIELIGRVCYKSEDKITPDSAERFVRMLIGRGHESVLEHGAITIRFICDRGVSHELVRHRVASFSQESTRYCNYGSDKHGGELTFIIPSSFDTGMGEASNSTVFDAWRHLCSHSERSYLELLRYDATPQQARSVLPNSLKTEVIMTANLREWRHVLKLRCSDAAHPDMRQLMRPLLSELRQVMPVFFEDIKI